MKIHRVLLQKSHSAARLARAAMEAARQKGLRYALSLVVKSLKGLELRGSKTPVERSDFDRQYGVDTSGIVRIAAMEIESPNYVHAAYYKASDPSQFRPALEALDIRYEDYTFVDYGSGKGLALLLASDMPFRRIIGVEFAKDLNEIAVENLRRYKNPTQKCFQIEALCMDATELEPPAGPLVCFFYDPFEACILQKVIARIEASYRAAPRDIILIYHAAPRTSAMHYEDRLHCLTSSDRPFVTKTHDLFDGQYLIFRSIAAAVAQSRP